MPLHKLGTALFVCALLAAAGCGGPTGPTCKSTERLQQNVCVPIPVPQGSLTIAGAPAVVSTQEVSVELALTAGEPEATEVRVSVGDGGNFAPFVARRTFVLSAGDGRKTIRAWCRNTGGESGPVEYAVLLDTSKPTGTLQIGDGRPVVTSDATTLAYGSARED